MSHIQHSTAFVKGGKLHAFGLYESSCGIMPFYRHCKVSSSVPEGTVGFGDDMHPALVESLKSIEGPVSHQIKENEMKAAAKELVERARVGDQNAVAILVRVRENAKRGNPRAQESHKSLMAYAKDHPPGSRMGAEEKKKGWLSSFFSNALASLRDALQSGDVIGHPEKYAAMVVVTVPAVKNPNHAAVALANGPDISNALAQAVQEGFSTDSDKRDYLFGGMSTKQKALAVAADAAPQSKKALQVGYVMGQARRIQNVRKAGYPIAPFDKMAAWELGEV